MTPKQPGICLSIDTSCDGSLADADTIRYHGPIEKRGGAREHITTKADQGGQIGSGP
ncbi:uncharacterized protein TRIVIDRAFT_220222 [Trichoderma virens Gv29-8]|uniref:Uncharacterized protein n=1 Tax=Hypocrea virens (strain Gv29-8 / FGSC 10586) TaxID=413071 RepID=G9MKN5_HYPVG|nr:uncharacterized protein TRIVIDRAFT_220222 [Trichoderma virens Gv29-8]EHK24782.1 hypothetical protein TRIVIDRAFT_220222 [Trichoderma virens Gv29-8]UKZ55045.1 hypothetical protein TrVGV298_008861 [Trichoderma virens]